MCVLLPMKWLSHAHTDTHQVSELCERCSFQTCVWKRQGKGALSSLPLLPAQPLSQNLMCTLDKCCLRCLKWHSFEKQCLFQNRFRRSNKNGLTKYNVLKVAHPQQNSLHSTFQEGLRILRSNRITSKRQRMDAQPRGTTISAHGSADTCSRLLSNCHTHHAWRASCMNLEPKLWKPNRHWKRPIRSSKGIQGGKKKETQAEHKSTRELFFWPPWRSQELAGPFARIPVKKSLYKVIKLSNVACVWE